MSEHELNQMQDWEDECYKNDGEEIMDKIKLNQETADKIITELEKYEWIASCEGKKWYIYAPDVIETLNSLVSKGGFKPITCPVCDWGIASDGTCVNMNCVRLGKRYDSLVSEDEEANAPIEFSLPVEIAIAKRLIEEYCEGLPNPLGLPVITHYIHVEDIFAWLDQQE